MVINTNTNENTNGSNNMSLYPAPTRPATLALTSPVENPTAARILGTGTFTPDTSDLSDAVGTWDFFFRRENNSRSVEAVAASCISLDLPLNTPLHDALALAHDAGLSLGSFRTGCFEIQTDAGIFAQVNGKRIELGTKGRAAKTTFKTWEQIEADELAETAALAA
jgi:hypothetical protein